VCAIIHVSHFSSWAKWRLSLHPVESHNYLLTMQAYIMQALYSPIHDIEPFVESSAPRPLHTTALYIPILSALLFGPSL
jgi:hypothetical protein